MPTPRVAIVLLNYNGERDTLECLASLRDATYPNLAVYLADNGSRSFPVKAFEEAYPGLVILENGANLGFAEGNNRAIRRALRDGCDVVALLNNDTLVHPGFVEPIVDYLARNPRAAAAGSRIYYANPPDVLWCAGGALDLPRGLALHPGKDGRDTPETERERDVDYVSGCALFARREAWEQVGLMDSDYFLYFEETEWCLRARRAGWTLGHVPASIVWHKVSASAGGEGSPLTEYYLARNRLETIRRHWSGALRWRAMAYQLLLGIPNDAYCRWRDGRGAHARALLAGARDFLLGRTGPRGVPPGEWARLKAE